MDTDHPPKPLGKRTGRRAGGASRKGFWVSLAARDDAAPFVASQKGETILNARGKALAAVWGQLGELREGVEPDALVIGPRSLEGILLFPGKSGAADLSGALRLFKVISALRLGQAGKTAALRASPVTEGKVAPKSPAPLWKKGYTEKSLAGAAALAQARKALKRMQAR